MVYARNTAMVVEIIAIVIILPALKAGAKLSLGFGGSSLRGLSAMACIASLGAGLVCIDPWAEELDALAE